jgi:hypothetical protein
MEGKCEIIYCKSNIKWYKRWYRIIFLFNKNLSVDVKEKELELRPEVWRHGYG